jgi:hypothetical protein
MVITVTWADGSRAEYRCDAWKVEWHVLYLTPPRVAYETQPKRCIPLDSVRFWTEDP